MTPTYRWPEIGLVLASLVIPGCADSPTSPGGRSSTAPAINVEVSGVRFFRPAAGGTGFLVDVRETSGKGLAFVTGIAVSPVGTTAGTCAISGLTLIAPKGDDEFSVNECALFPDAAPASVNVDVTFKDVDGRQGSVRTTTPVQGEVDPPRLEIDLFSAQLSPTTSTGYYFYITKLVLRETAGSTATVSSVTFESPNGFTDSECRWSLIPIPGHQSWDLSSLGYCAPYFMSRTPEESVTVKIVYSGLAGGTQTLSQTVSTR